MLLLVGSFDWLFLATHLAVMIVGGFVLFREPLQGLQWSLFSLFGFIALSSDSLARRSRSTTFLHLAGLCTTLAMFGGLRRALLQLVRPAQRAVPCV